MRGFTLIEIVIAMALIAVLMTISVVNFRSSKQNDALLIVASRIAEEFRTAQTQAISGYSDTYADSRGFGVHVDEGTQELFVFADMFVSSNEKIGIWTSKEENAESTDVLLPNQPISLAVSDDESIIIESITIDGAPVTDADMAFTVQSGAGLINGSDQKRVLEITLKHVKNTNVASNTRKITIHRVSGRIDVQH